MRRAVRCGSGLGDSLYLQALVRYYAHKGEQVEALTDFPDIFRPLVARFGDHVLVTPFRRHPGPITVAHYAGHRSRPGTTQFEDVCRSAGVVEKVELRLDWTVTHSELVGAVRERAAGRPIILVQLPREPMGRTDGYGTELLPDCTAIQKIIDYIGRKALFVQVGKGTRLFNFKGILDFADQTTVAQMIDVAFTANAALGYVSFIVPLAESLNKPLLTVWSRMGYKSRNALLRTITPEKILTKGKTHATVMDDADAVSLRAAAEMLLHQAEGGRNGRVHHQGAAAALL